MLFTEFLEGVETDSNLFDLNAMKINAYCERAFREYEINMKESEYKILTESGTEDDLDYLYEAAGESLGEKIKRATIKVIENLKKFAASIGNRIKGFFTGNQKNIDSVAKRFSNSPRGRNAKVKVLNKKKADSIFKQTEAKLKKAVVAAKHGRADENTFKKIMADHKKAVAGIGTIMISVASAFGFLKYKDYTKKFNSEVLELQRELGGFYQNLDADSLKEIQKELKKDKDKNVDIKGFTRDVTVSKKAYSAFVNSYANLKKEKIKLDMDHVKSVWSGIRETVSKLGAVAKNKLPKGKNQVAEETTNESFFDDFDDYSIFDESEDYDDYDEDIYEESEFDDVFDESEEYEEDVYEESEFDDIFGDDDK